MTTFTSDALRSIRSLEAHGAYIRTERGAVPLTTEFCQKALESLTGAMVGVNYDFGLPGIDFEFMLCVNRDGTVDAGGKEAVEALLWHRNNRICG